MIEALSLLSVEPGKAVALALRVSGGFPEKPSLLCEIRKCSGPPDFVGPESSFRYFFLVD